MPFQNGSKTIHLIKSPCKFVHWEGRSKEEEGVVNLGQERDKSRKKKKEEGLFGKEARGKPPRVKKVCNFSPRAKQFLR